jgi:hypothetical protein
VTERLRRQDVGFWDSGGFPEIRVLGHLCADGTVLDDHLYFPSDQVRDQMPALDHNRRSLGRRHQNRNQTAPGYTPSVTIPVTTPVTTVASSVTNVTIAPKRNRAA